MALLLALVVSVRAEIPMAPFPDCSEDDKAACPNDLNDWYMIGWLPSSAVNVRKDEKKLGSGVSADVAFRYTAGRWDVPVAVLDSGIYWQDERLAGKVFLNVGELPPAQDATGTEVGDLDGNGLINVFDYAEDPRVSIDAGVGAADHMLDPSDLIYTFSDGVDDDGNGYVDDIAGWDFFDFDNDPFARLQGLQADHGTGVMKTIGEAGNDGGGIGICPNCSIIPVRTGDAFISTGDRIGLSIAYAADAGARAISMALGGLTQARLTRDAIYYADANGVVVVSVAGDENSYHHNYPAQEGPILYVHSIRSNTNNEGDPDVYSFMNIWNCNNWGPRMDVVAPANACATGASAMTAGAAGLLISAGYDAGLDPELTVEEVKSLIRTTVDDVNTTPAEQEEASAYPSKEGWDAFYGYGRLNVGRAVQAVFEGEIPPTARIDSPDWWKWVDPDAGTVPVRGVIEARGGVKSWTLRVGEGAEPEDWTEVASGKGAVDGKLAEFDPSSYGDHVFEDLTTETVVERMYRAHEPLLTLELTVEDEDGLVGVDRNAFWTMRDPDLLPGFPVVTEASMDSGPVLADLDGDEIFEIIVATADSMMVLNGQGDPLPGWPVETDTLAPLAEGQNAAEAYASGAVDPESPEGFIAGAAVGDLDGDGTPEVVGVSLEGGIYAWHADGRRVKGFPQRILGRTHEEFGKLKAWENGIMSTPALGDVDGDGDLEIIAAAMDQYLYVFHEDGSLHDGFPLELCDGEYCTDLGARILASPTLGDIDGDGDLDCAIGTNELPPGAAGLLYIVDLKKAEIWPGYPLPRKGLINQSVLPVIGEGHPSSAGLADIDDDGVLEFASTPMLATTGLVDNAGNDVVEFGFTADSYGFGASFTDGAFLSAVSNPSFGDMNGDGVPEFFLGGPGVQWAVSLALTTMFEYQHAFGAWDGATGEALPGFPRQVDDISFLVAATVADVSGDGKPEAIYGSGGYFLYAWDIDGNSPEGWPKFTGGWLLGGAALGDIDGDGHLDVVATTRERNLFAWRSQGDTSQDVQWASTFHDPMNTGNYTTPLVRQPFSKPVEDEPVSTEDEGGCCKKKSSGGDALVLFPLLLWWRRRR